MKKAIFLDIDGTLIDCMGGIKDITPNVKRAIKKVQEKGDYVFISTGRPYALLDKNILDFGFDGFILANGAHVIINNETIYSEPIEKEFIKNIVTQLENNNIQYILQGELYSYMKESCKDFYKYYDEIGVNRTYFKDEFNIEEIDVHKFEMLCPNDEIKELCLSLIKTNPECDYFSSVNKSAVEVYLKKNTKGRAILKAIDFLDIKIENTYAFGDGKNDIEMLLTVGCGIAMGNANDEVKKHSNKITDTVQNDGVAKGIEQYVYID